VVYEDASGGKSIVAYVVPSAGQLPATDELRSTLRQKLPAYMLPSRFVFLEALPLTSNGKVDRNSLSLTTPLSSKEGAPCVKARSPLEAQILEIWEEILEGRPIGVQDNFFDLGGHSLLGAKLVARMEQKFGKKLSFSVLFQAPTVEKMAAILRDESFVAPASRLLPIQPLGFRPPLFWVGAGPFVRPLSQHLKTDQPFMGLIFKPSDVAELSRPYDVRKIAQEFVAAAREAQPEGPYFLGGHCLSGVIAYEAAKQLMGQGHQVALLVLIEADNPTVDPKPPKRSRANELAARLRVHLSRMRQMKVKESLGYIFDQLLGLVRQMKQGPSKPSSETRPPAVGSQADYIEDILRILGSAVDTYEEGHYPGRVVEFRCSEPDVPPDQPPQYDWSSIVTGSFERYEVPGDHMAMMSEPNVEILGNILTACLRESYEVAGGPATYGPAQEVNHRR
jgi:thioesterase domain-containing protein